MSDEAPNGDQQEHYLRIDYDPVKQEFAVPKFVGKIPIEHMLGYLQIVTAGLVGSYAMQKAQANAPDPRRQGGKILMPGPMMQPPHHFRGMPPGYDHG